MKKSALLLLSVLGFHMLWSNNTSYLPKQRISLDADLLAYRSFLPIRSDMRFPEASNSIESIVLPLKRAGNLIMLEAIIDSIQGNLILDTGSAGFALNRMYFRQGRIDPGQISGGVTGSAGTVSTMRVNNMRIAELSFNRLEATIIDMGHIENARNVKILGFFGLVLFADYEVVIDLQNSVLELHRLNLRGNRIQKPNPAIRHDMQLTTKVNSNVVFLDAVINNSKLTFCLDTGAESNVLGSGLPGRVLNTIDITGRSTLRGAGAQQVEVLYGKMNDFSIERQEIKGMNVIITNLNAMSHFYGIPTHGMLGCEFLEKGTFFINLKQERLGIIFNKEDRK